ncbi:hypothetical protein HBI70_184780 [Parastagonospora nodorum]|nr:hypothetical protein HBH47_143920 [Parastagonospora nodorum]KAH4403537.1 hypothetical protein HBH92_197740 [Parastagonospora nodorum]KAH4421267.1 hypothetical protein HBH93_202000 [Parastagonospora nodorum]KAH4434156.1 hypothetical protein HBH91_210350 [Parastagonospora nodorum]KAH4499906.1 hypothetical protein HBH89_121790 [Parastagonospora nodorum]
MDKDLPRTKEALSARVEKLCNAIYDERNTDPWGGDGYLSTILRTVKPADTSEYSTIPKLNEAKDYSTSAQKELVVREQSASLIKTAQELSTFIRDLQELWLFGGLDTLAEKEDEEATRAKAVQVAEIIEKLAGSKSVGGKKENGADEELKKE